jgi:hypothetical protein
MSTKKITGKAKPNAFLGSLERFGGKKLMQSGASKIAPKKEGRRHLVGGGH